MDASTTPRRGARRAGVLTAVWLAIFLGPATPGDERSAAAQPDFDTWLAGLRDEARQQRRISGETLDAALRDVRPIPRVIELDRHQPEGTLTFEAYLARLINDARVRDGRERLVRHRGLLEEIRARYGVQPRFLVALWGIESDFGRRTGSFSVVASLATLAWDGRRARFFRGELLDALTILDEGHVDAAGMQGSWAGAMGQPQFMPSSFRRYAVDHDGDARRDIWNNVGDVLASAANYLASAGWKGDQIWGRPVRLPAGFDGSLVGGKTRKTLAGWQSLGVRRADGTDLPRAAMEGAIVQPGGPDGPSYLVYDNYRALLRWNRSDYFATAVGILSDRIAGR